MAARKRIHVQIALVGGQPTPVYQGIVHLKPDQVVLICSESSEDMANNIRQQLPSYTDNNVLIYKISDTDLQDMYKTAEMIESVLPKGITISLNLTGGMKLWMVVFNNVFRRKRRSCRSFFIGQNGRYFDLKNKETQETVAFDMEAQFKILGHQMMSYTELSEYTKEDNQVLNQIQQWGFSDKTHYPLFNLTKQFYDEYKAQFKNVKFDHPFSVVNKYGELSWNPENSSFQGQLCWKTIQLSSPHAPQIVLNTGWFELYVARMIQKTYPDYQIWMNCEFKNRNNKTKNEVDIIVNTGNKLIFVECKTQVFESTAVDKFRSVVTNFGGLGSKHLFVTYSPMKAEAKEKCDDYGITTFNFENPAYKTNEDRIQALKVVLDGLNQKWNIK